MADFVSHVIPAVGTVHGLFSDRSDGDLAPHGERVHMSFSEHDAILEARRSALAPTPWTWMRQVHGAGVLEVHTPGHRAGDQADACVTGNSGVTLSVTVADCAPVLLFSPVQDSVVVGAAHAGWRGLEAGVLEATVDAMRDLGATEISWWLGPCIGASRYEFSGVDLDRLVSRFGASVRSQTDDGRPALDMRAAVGAAMGAAGVTAPHLRAPSACTALSDQHWSHREGAATQRQVGAIWWEAGR